MWPHERQFDHRERIRMKVSRNIRSFLFWFSILNWASVCWPLIGRPSPMSTSSIYICFIFNNSSGTKSRICINISPALCQWAALQARNQILLFHQRCLGPQMTTKVHSTHRNRAAHNASTFYIYTRSNAQQKAIKKIIIFHFQRIGNHMFSFLSYGRDVHVEVVGVVFAICRTQSKFIWSTHLTFCF